MQYKGPDKNYPARYRLISAVEGLEPPASTFVRGALYPLSYTVKLLQYTTPLEWEKQIPQPFIGPTVTQQGISASERGILGKPKTGLRNLRVLLKLLSPGPLPGRLSCHDLILTLGTRIRSFH